MSIRRVYNPILLLPRHIYSRGAFFYSVVRTKPKQKYLPSFRVSACVCAAKLKKNEEAWPTFQINKQKGPTGVLMHVLSNVSITRVCENG